MNILIALSIIMGYLIVGVLFKWYDDRIFFKRTKIDNGDNSYPMVALWPLVILISIIFIPIGLVSESKLYTRIRTWIRGY